MTVIYIAKCEVGVQCMDVYIDQLTWACMLKKKVNVVINEV